MSLPVKKCVTYKHAKKLQNRKTMQTKMMHEKCHQPFSRDFIQNGGIAEFKHSRKNERCTV